MRFLYFGCNTLQHHNQNGENCMSENECEIELTGIGAALVDVLSHVTDEFIEDQRCSGGTEKGTMALIDEARATALYDLLPPAIESSGGSVANTMACFASFGGNGAFVGKIADDQLGGVFAHDMKALGVSFNTQKLLHEQATGRSLVLITPDAQRTMNTYLGAACALSEDDLPVELIQKSKITYVEGYLFDSEEPAKAAIKAAEIAKDAGRQFAVSLSDPLCVDRHRAIFHSVIDDGVDILIANEAELKSLHQTDDLEKAMEQIKCKIAAVTRSDQGVIIIENGEKQTIAAVPDVDVIDTTGAGDSFAAGFLFGIARGMPLLECGRLGVRAAAIVIASVGARPDKKLLDLIGK